MMNISTEKSIYKIPHNPTFSSGKNIIFHKKIKFYEKKLFFIKEGEWLKREWPNYYKLERLKTEVDYVTDNQA